MSRASQVTIPVDTEAEETLAGCAAATAKGARLACSRVTADDLYDPRCARVIDRCLDSALATAEMAAPAGHKQDGRLVYLSSLAEVDPEWLSRIVFDRAVYRDEDGQYARRVFEGSRRRRLMAVAADLHSTASTGSWAELDALLQLALCLLEEVSRGAA